MNCSCCTNHTFFQNTYQGKRWEPVIEKDFLVAPVINFGNTIQNWTKKIFFLNPCLLQIFSTSRINKVRLAIIWAHNKVFVTQSDALSSYYLFATVFAQYMALSAHRPSNVCVKSQIIEDFCSSYHKACKLLSKICENLLFRFK